MRRRETNAIAVIEQSSQQAGCLGFESTFLGLAIGLKTSLHLIPQFLRSDCFMLSRIGLVLVHCLASIKAVVQQLIERPAGEGGAARAASRLTNSLFAFDARAVQFVFQFGDAAQCHVATIDMLNPCSLFGIDYELAIGQIVAQRQLTAHPHALALGGRDLVADALTRHLTLELSEGEQYI